MLESLCCVGVGLGPFQEQQKGKAPLVSLHCPQHTSCSCVSSQKWMCSDSAICGGFLCLPTGSPSSLLCIGSATRENLSLTSSRVSRTTLSTCKGLCLQTTGPEVC